MVTVFVEVTGGVVQSVYTDGMPAKVVIIDYDNGESYDQEEGIPDDDIIMIPQGIFFPDAPASYDLMQAQYNERTKTIMERIEGKEAQNG